MHTHSYTNEWKMFSLIECEKKTKFEGVAPITTSCIYSLCMCMGI